MFSGIYLQYPYLLSLIVLFLICEKFCKMKLPSIYFPHAKQFMQQSISNSKFLFLLKWVVIVMLVLSISSPVRDEPYEIEPKHGHEIALVLDASESMMTRGFDMSNPSLTRFDVVKDIVSDFISQRKHDNIGLVVFGAYSFIASPLTYDVNILDKIVSQLYVGMAGKYTALYESIAQGVNLLKMSKSKSKVMILLTDGYNTPGTRFPYDVAVDMAKKEKIKIYPIGIGSPGEYNQRVLLKIAKATGAVAYGASSASELKEVYKQIDKLERSEIKSEKFTYMKYYYMYPLFVSFFSLMLYLYLQNRRGHN